MNRTNSSLFNVSRRSTLGLVLLAGAIALSSACGGGGGRLLVVDLRTDYVPVVEVVQVETKVLSSSGTPVQTRTFGVDSDLLAGLRAADFSDVGANEQTIELRLLAPGSRVLAKRRVVVTVASTGITGVTVNLTRDCLTVVCPGGGDASATECLNGHCVPPTCSVARPELCGDANCNSDEDCGASTSACATRRCSANACLDTPIEGACMAAEVCLPTGCTPRPGTDAGAVDASVDAATDASADSGMDAGASSPSRISGTTRSSVGTRSCAAGSAEAPCADSASRTGRESRATPPSSSCTRAGRCRRTRRPPRAAPAGGESRGDPSARRAFACRGCACRRPLCLGDRSVAEDWNWSSPLRASRAAA